ncbi:MAG: GNAT family N-acetyltransferase [Ignavibacteria bacterium]|nr:GNAT family N-acetyltransferase [Ignavibacteria bacterium]
MDIQPLTLEGTYVRLEPLSLEHLDALCDGGLDPSLWQWTTNIIRTPEEMREYIEEALDQQQQGTALPFATIERSSGRAIGSTRFGNIDKGHRRVEIGWTWVMQPWQRTPINTESKYLMLKHAFETLGCIRVEFKTDSLNEPSRVALRRIGAKEEGILRNHMITYTGRIRHSVYYSILDSEWPRIKSELERKLASPLDRNS